MSRVMRCAVGVLSFILLLAIPSAVFAADAPPSIFYVYMESTDGSGTPILDLVEINATADTLTKMIPVETESQLLSTSLEDVLPDEWAAFQQDLQTVPAEEQARVRDEMSVNPSITPVLQIWETAPRVFLLHREIRQCFSTLNPEVVVPPIAPICYGAYQFSLFSAETQTEHVVWTRPYHTQEGAAYNDCYWTWLYENYSGHEMLDQVLIHPTRDLIALRFWNYGSCPNAAFLVDYASETPVVTEISYVDSMTWSPDGAEMAYVYRNQYATIDLTTLEQTFLETTPASYWDNLWIAWPAPDILILAKTTLKDDATTQSLVWHNRQTGEETVLDLPEDQTLFYSVSLQEAASTIIIGVGDTGIGYFSHPNVALDDTPGVFKAENVPTPYLSRSRNRQYAMTAEGIMDADLNLYPIDLKPYRERYGAAAIRLAAIGVERS